MKKTKVKTIIAATVFVILLTLIVAVVCFTQTVYPKAEFFRIMLFMEFGILALGLL